MVVFSVLKISTMLLASLSPSPSPSSGGVSPLPCVRDQMTPAATASISTPMAMRKIHSPFLLRFPGGGGGGAAPAGMGRGCT